MHNTSWSIRNNISGIRKNLEDFVHSHNFKRASENIDSICEMILDDIKFQEALAKTLCEGLEDMRKMYASHSIPSDGMRDIILKLYDIFCEVPKREVPNEKA